MADLHLGVSFKSVRGKNISKVVNKHILENVERAFRYAVNNSVDVVLIAGDIFNNLHVSLNYSYALASKLSLLYKHGIHTIIVAGNHDAPRVRGIHSPLTVLSQLGVEKVYYQESLPDKALKINLNEGCLGVAPLPYFQSNERKYFQDQLSKLIRKLYADIKDCEFKILIGHYDVKGAKYSEDDPYANSFYNITQISPETLEPSLFNYIALGHIHLHQVLKGYNNIFYSGSIDRMSFGEASEKKGFLDIELYEKPFQAKFIESIPIKMHITPFLEVSETNPISSIIQYLDTVELENMLIRIRVKADSVAWSLIKDSMGKLDRYLLEDRNVLGYRVDPYLRNVYAQLKLERISVDKDWLRNALYKYVDSISGISYKDIDKMKRLITSLLSKESDEAGEI